MKASPSITCLLIGFALASTVQAQYQGGGYGRNYSPGWSGASNVRVLDDRPVAAALPTPASADANQPRILSISTSNYRGANQAAIHHTAQEFSAAGGCGAGGCGAQSCCGCEASACSSCNSGCCGQSCRQKKCKCKQSKCKKSKCDSCYGCDSGCGECDSCCREKRGLFNNLFSKKKKCCQQCNSCDACCSTSHLGYPAGSPANIYDVPPTEREYHPNSPRIENLPQPPTDPFIEDPVSQSARRNNVAAGQQYHASQHYAYQQQEALRYQQQAAMQSAQQRHSAMPTMQPQYIPQQNYPAQAHRYPDPRNALKHW